MVPAGLTAAALVALVTAGASARPGGLAGGGVASPPLAAPAPMARPAVVPHRPAFSRPVGATIRAHAPEVRQRARGAFPLWGGMPWYGASYDYAPPYYPPPADVGTYEPVSIPQFYPPVHYPPVESYVRPVQVYVVPYRPGCQSEVKQVPSANGDEERAITIVRC